MELKNHFTSEVEHTTNDVPEFSGSIMPKGKTTQVVRSLVSRHDPETVANILWTVADAAKFLGRASSARHDDVKLLR